MTVKVFNKARDLYMEAFPEIGLVYICESKGNKLINICTIDEIKKILETMEK